MTNSTRRISYVVPFPPTPPPWLQLPSSTHPRNGSPYPLLFPSDHPPLSSHASIDPPSVHPQHSLGVPAMALDTSTQLAAQDAPQGILYTGGRDGLLAGWELNMRLRRRTAREGREGAGKADWVRWNELGVEGIDDGLDDEPTTGSSSGAPTPSLSSDRPSSDGEKLPFEDRWEVDTYAQGEIAPKASFRQSCQFHTDWVNDILLTNLNRTLISASSDRTIRAWSPHSSSSDASTSSTVIGHHTDFVRCLAHSRHQSWVASGGFDRHIKLWDVSSASLASVGSGGHPTPLLVLNQSEERTEKSSIYSLATNVQGSMVASGSPEQTINVWDPRMGGAKRIAKLVGHTDNVRSLLLSEDGRFMLSGSADATVKLWSMSAQRVIHTFTHHEDSVWSLASTHPNLERFYAGDRSGTVSVTDMSRCQSIPEGESYVLCQEGADRTLNREGEASLSPLASRGSVGINKIVSLGDQWVWTSTSSSDVHLWQDVGSRTRRVPGFRPVRTSDAANGDNADEGIEADGAIDDDEGEGMMVGGAWSHSPPAQPTSILASSSPVPTEFQAGSLLGSTGMVKRLSLDRTPSREVAFAPHLANGGTSSPGGTSGAASFANSPLANLHRPTAGLHHHSSARTLSGETALPSSSKPSLDGIPYESLVSLGQPESPYSSYGFRHSRYSVGSIGSLPRRPSSQPFANGESANPTPTQRHPELPDENAPSPFVPAQLPTAAVGESVREARLDFEEREIVGDAVPLRADPADIIKGRSGLVRSLMLNDRQHAITLSTAGVVAVWNIVLSTCLGLIAQEDVLEAHILDHAPVPAPPLTPRGALELVKERIEGEAVVPAWCTVDTKIGALGIHMEQGRCFDAEIHLDELGDRIRGSFREDQRVSLGKLLLANLFSGFVDAEVARSQASFKSSATPTPASGISRSSAPTQISFSPSSFKPSGTTTPGAMSSLATPAMTPALAPEAGDFFRFTTDTSAPTSPGANGETAQTVSDQPPTPKATDPHHDPRGGQPQPERGRDYFSIGGLGRSTSSSAASKRFSMGGGSQPASLQSADDPPASPILATSDVPLPTPGSSVTTPGGSFLGKFKGLGKNKKASAAAVATPAVVAESTEEEAEPIREDDEHAGLSEVDRYQKRVLANLFSQEVTPPNPAEVPFIAEFPDATIFIDEESKDAGAWAVTYRGLASTTAVDLETLEMALPTWVLEFLLTGRSLHKETVKISFILKPEDKDDLDELPGGNNRLSANRALRARKISSYVMDRLGMGIPRSRAVSLSGNSAAPTPQGSPRSHTTRLPPVATGMPPPGTREHPSGSGEDEDLRPEDVIELVCGGVVVPPKMTLAAVKHVFRQSGDVQLTFRRKQRADLLF